MNVLQDMLSSFAQRVTQGAAERVAAASADPKVDEAAVLASLAAIAPPTRLSRLLASAAAAAAAALRGVELGGVAAPGADLARAAAGLGTRARLRRPRTAVLS